MNTIRRLLLAANVAAAASFLLLPAPAEAFDFAVCCKEGSEKKYCCQNCGFFECANQPPCEKDEDCNKN